MKETEKRTLDKCDLSAKGVAEMSEQLEQNLKIAYTEFGSEVTLLAKEGNLTDISRKCLSKGFLDDYRSSTAPIKRQNLKRANESESEIEPAPTRPATKTRKTVKKSAQIVLDSSSDEAQSKSSNPPPKKGPLPTTTRSTRPSRTNGSKSRDVVEIISDEENQPPLQTSAKSSTSRPKSQRGKQKFVFSSSSDEDFGPPRAQSTQLPRR